MTYIEELKMLEEQNDGLLSPHKVVEFAEDPDTALHSKFDWNDSTAGLKWRLHQARMLINVLVTVIEDIKVDSYVSLVSDRKRDDTGGYRSIEAVLASEEMEQMLFSQCKRQIDILIAKFKTCQRLSQILEMAKSMVEAEIKSMPPPKPKKPGRPPEAVV